MRLDHRPDACHSPTFNIETLESRRLLSSVYSVIDTGLTTSQADPLLNSVESCAHINDSGLIIGTDPTTGQPAAYVPTSAAAGNILLLNDGQTLTGGKPLALGLNDNGQILLEADQTVADPTTPGGSDQVPCSYVATVKNGAATFALPTAAQLKDYDNITATVENTISEKAFVGAVALNDSGVAVGVQGVQSVYSQNFSEAYSFKLDGDVTPVGGLGGGALLFAPSYPEAINASGDAVGQDFSVSTRALQTPKVTIFPSLWTYNAKKHSYTKEQAVTPSRDGEGVATGINDSGLIVGDMDEKVIAPEGLDAYTAAAFVRTVATKTKAAKILSVTPLAGDNAEDLLAVNNSGVAVGDSYHASKNGELVHYHAIMWYINSKGHAVTLDLNTLLPSGSGWVLTQATGINSSGQIVGIGTFNGAKRVFLLDPPGLAPA